MGTGEGPASLESPERVLYTGFLSECGQGRSGAPRK